MANVDFLVASSDSGYAIHLQVPTLAAAKNAIFPVNGGYLASLSDTTQVYNGPIRINIIGSATPTELFNCGLLIWGDSSDYIQASIQNKNSGGSIDWTLTTDTGNDSTGYATFGINCSAWTNPSWTINGPMDAYISCAGGGVAVGTDTAGKAVILYCGGTLASYIKFKATDTYVVVYRKTLPVGIGGVWWTKITSTTLASWTTAATCLGAASTGVHPDGSTQTLTLPADFFVIGRTLRLRAIGTLTTANSTPTMNVAFKLGATTVLSTGSNSMVDNNATFDWILEVELLCVAVGSTATIKAKGRFVTQNSTLTYDWLFPMRQTTPANIDTTITQTIDVTVACSASSANNTFTNYATWIDIAG
jgi:hypothetical protein